MSFQGDSGATPVTSAPPVAALIASLTREVADFPEPGGSPEHSGEPEDGKKRGGTEAA